MYGALYNMNIIIIFNLFLVDSSKIMSKTAGEKKRLKNLTDGFPDMSTFNPGVAAQ